MQEELPAKEQAEVDKSPDDQATPNTKTQRSNTKPSKETCANESGVESSIIS
jgi:hypothetical protein